MPLPISPNLIADAAVAGIRSLNLVPDEKVVKRKVPSLPSGIDPPGIVVVVGEGGEEGKTEPIDARTKLNRYPTTVIIITAAGGKLTGDDEIVREWRTLIEAKLDGDARVTFASVPGFNKSDCIGKAPFDGSVLPKDLNYSAQTFVVEVLEQTKATP